VLPSLQLYLAIELKPIPQSALLVLSCSEGLRTSLFADAGYFTRGIAFYQALFHYYKAIGFFDYFVALTLGFI